MTWIVYKHTCTITGKSYVGSTKNSITLRWQQHCSKARTENSNNKFQQAIRLYSEENWTHEILAENIPTLEEALGLERFYVRKFDCFENGYNETISGFLEKGCFGNHIHKNTGIKRSSETIAKCVAGRELARSKYTEDDKNRIGKHIIKGLMEKRYKSEKVTLYHKDHGIVTGFLIDLIHKYNIHTEIYNVVKGKRRYVQGWFLYVGENGNYDEDPIYTFVHPEYGEETMTLKDMCKKYNLSKGNLCMVAKGQRNHTHGWRIKYVDR